MEGERWKPGSGVEDLERLPESLPARTTVSERRLNESALGLTVQAVPKAAAAQEATTVLVDTKKLEDAWAATQGGPAADYVGGGGAGAITRSTRPRPGAARGPGNGQARRDAKGGA